MDTKTCKGCLTEKPTSEFYRHKMMADGFLNFCKQCFKKSVKAYRKTPGGKKMLKKERAKHADKYREWKRAYKKTEKGKLATKRYVRPSYKNRAKDAVHNALRSGRLIRQPCIKCGEKAEAHHPSYDRDMWLNVIWLCQKHHNELHKQENSMKTRS